MNRLLAATLSLACALALPNGKVWAAGETEDSTGYTLGDYVPLRVDTFEEREFVRVTRAEHCVSEAWKEVQRYKRSGASVETLVHSRFYSFYRILTANDQRIAVVCNQNGALIVGWKPDSDVVNFVKATTIIGIGPREKAIDKDKTAPPVVINNNSR